MSIHALQQTAAAILVFRAFTALGAAVAAERGVRPGAVAEEVVRMLRAVAILSIALLGCSGQRGIPTDDQEPTKRTMSLSLETVEKAVQRGAAPKFRLTIRNDGRDAERVIELRGGRLDLQDTYYDLVVTEGDKDVGLGRAVSCPGPTSDEDFLTLKPGEEVTFDLSRFRIALESLPPGTYTARVRFWQDPHKSSRSILLSPPIEFVVRE